MISTTSYYQSVDGERFPEVVVGEDFNSPLSAHKVLEGGTHQQVAEHRKQKTGGENSSTMLYNYRNQGRNSTFTKLQSKTKVHYNKYITTMS